ncbi:hypothetical protein CLOM_g798 [Closterium sp. NIES-68]|nr:hypothetical protein CLOM_g798 [Closterium sp. NIES-68]GJP64126.1 hypothetical protein CLOP_g21147 [Closterium sp. NIES-67]
MFGSRHLSFTDASSLLSSPADSAADSAAGGLNSRRPSSPLLTVSSEPDIEHSGGGGGHTGRASSFGGTGGAGIMSGLGAGGMGGEARRVRTRMPLENHAPVAPSEGGVAILRGSLNTDLSSLTAASALLPYTRDFIFPGELLQVVVHRTPIDPLLSHPSFPEPPLAEPPGEARDSSGQHPYHQPVLSGDSGAAIGVSGGGGGGGEGGESAVVAADGLSAVGPLSGGVSVGGREDGEVRQQRTRELLEIAQRSLYDVHLSEPMESASRVQNQQQQQQQQAGREAVQTPSAFGVMPVPADIAGYDPATAAGLGRRVVSTCSLPNGDVVVLLEVAVSTTALIPDATLEIRQFERFPMPFGPPSAATPPPAVPTAAADDEGGGADTDAAAAAAASSSADGATPQASDSRGKSLPPPALGTTGKAEAAAAAGALEESQDLLFWLFPLERLPPLSTATPAAAARPAIPLPAVATSGWGTPSAFNFTAAAPPTPSVAPSTPVGFSLSLPRVSTPSASTLAATSTLATTGGSSPSNSPRKRHSSGFRDDAGGGGGGGGGGTVLGGLAWGTHETGAVGWEGLLSFRGVPLEPQRFSGNCGRLGPFVPGRKWVRGVRVLQPLCVESYTAECGHEDVICVMVENILPREGATAGVILYVDSISLEARSSVSMSLQQSLPVHVARLESGSSKEALPGLPLRPGEQHSFIITPQCSGNAQIVKAPSGANKDGGGGRGRRLAGGGGGGGGGGGSARGGGALGGNEGSSNSLAAAFSFTRMAEKTLALEEESEGEDMPVDSSPEYSLIISCSCSHTAAQLRYRHPLAWRPRPPRDLLLSISPDNISSASPPSSSSSSASSSSLPTGTDASASTSASSSHILTLPDGTLVAASPSSGQYSRPLTVRVRVTNLTASDLNLTLLAPTTLAATSLSRVCFPTSPRHSSNLLAGDSSADPLLLEQQQGQGQGQGEEDGSEDEEGLSPAMSPLRVFKSSTLAASLDPPDGSRSLVLPDFLRNRSLHPKPPPSLSSEPAAGKPLGISSSSSGGGREGGMGEGGSQNLPVSASGSGGGGAGGAGGAGDGRERSVSAAELVAMHVPHRTHLWLQSVVPMGKVPALGTSEVRCELVPLVDGLINLDTLHITTKRRDTLFFPEHPLKIYCPPGFSAKSESSSSPTNHAPHATPPAAPAAGPTSVSTAGAGAASATSATSGAGTAIPASAYGGEPPSHADASLSASGAAASGSGSGSGSGDDGSNGGFDGADDVYDDSHGSVEPLA